jgi:hypothetical protein
MAFLYQRSLIIGSPFPDQLPCDSTGDSTRVGNEFADRFIRGLTSLQSLRHSPTWATSELSDGYTISDTGTVSSEGAITSQSVEASHGSRRALAALRREPPEASRTIMVKSVARLGIEPILVGNPNACAYVPLSTERRMSAKKPLSRVSCGFRSIPTIACWRMDALARVLTYRPFVR